MGVKGIVLGVDRLRRIPPTELSAAKRRAFILGVVVALVAGLPAGFVVWLILY